MEPKYSIAHLLGRMQANWPKAASIETEIALGLVRLNDLGTDSVKTVLTKYDLSLAGFEVLFTLRSLPEPRQLTPTELYKSILISSGGMTKVLKHLEKNGWIERINNPDDKRSKFVKLTENGKQLAEESMIAVNESDRRLFSSSLSETELTQLRDILLGALSKVETD
jgi:DNA-binding MarR family transcriptional regulator